MLNEIGTLIYTLTLNAESLCMMLLIYALYLWIFLLWKASIAHARARGLLASYLRTTTWGRAELYSRVCQFVRPSNYA